MKRSHSIQLTLLASLAALLTGCNQNRPPRRCVDSFNRVVGDDNCREDTSGAYVPYRWYYGGPRGFVPMGAMMNGGSTVPPRGASYPSLAPTTRGVIGGAGRAASSGSHGGGAGE